ncbi:MAG: DUF2867 domain-containing protein [Alistipes sp.]|nr:DUF2867 domain-containing protein [Alistipes sp.]
MADYADTYTRELAVGSAALTAPEAMRRLFTEFPGWIRGLLALRDVCMKPFGLQTQRFEHHLTSMIQHESDEEVLLGLQDRHLDFRVFVTVSPLSGQKQRVSVTTQVDFHHRGGRLYFTVIRPFHRWIVRSQLRRL